MKQLKESINKKLNAEVVKVNMGIVKAGICLRQSVNQSGRFAEERGEFGIGSIIAVAIGLIVGAFVLIPGARTFATTVLADMTSWWSTNVKGTLFPIK